MTRQKQINIPVDDQRKLDYQDAANKALPTVAKNLAPWIRATLDAEVKRLNK